MTDRQVLIHIDLDDSSIYCSPPQSPADMLDHALNLAVSAIVTSVMSSGTNPLELAKEAADYFNTDLTESVTEVIQQVLAGKAEM